MLRMTGISKSYGPVRVLDQVDLSAGAGEVLALMGENGAGKSTLVKILAGIEPANAGDIVIDGTARRFHSTAQARAAGIGYVAQELSIIDSLSVAENVFLGDETIGVIRSARRLARLARPFLDRVGLEHVDPLASAERYSVAERQLVEIARLLSRGSRIAILDEPTAALSDAEIVRVKAAVRGLASQGCAVIYVTHRMPEVFELAGRVVVLRNGKSFPALDVATLSVDRLIETMLGRHLGDMFPPRAKAPAKAVMRSEAALAAGLSTPLSIEVRAGEILALAGQLGSGASAALRMLAGVQALAAGSLRLEGTPYAPRNPREAIARGIAYCSDDRKRDGIFAGRRVVENLSAPALRAISGLQLISRRKEAEHAQSISRKLGIDGRYLARLAGNLSGGNQQKVALGKWVGLNPRVLLVEEPTRGVDVGARAEIYRHLRELADGGLAIVFASSDTQEVLGLADRIGTFFHGRLVRILDGAVASAEGLAHDITNSAALSGRTEAAR